MQIFISYKIVLKLQIDIMVTRMNHEILSNRMTIRRSVNNSSLPNVSNFLDIRIEGSFHLRSLRMPEIPSREGINAFQG